MNLVWKYLGLYKKESILAPLFKLLEALGDLFVPLVVADIINTGIANGDTGYLLSRFGILILLALAALLCSFTAQWFAATASVGTASRMRQALFDHIGDLSYTELDALGTNTMITRLTSDINQVQSGLNLALRLLLRSPFIVFGSMIMAFTIDFKCAMVFALAIPVLLAVVFWIMLTSIPMYKKVQAELDKVLGAARENLTGVRVIRAFRKEQDEIRDFDQKNDALTVMNEKVGRLSALLNPLTYALINIAAIILIQKGALQVNLGVIQQGDVVALYNYMAQMIVELIKLASLIISIDKAIACAGRVQKVMEIPSSMTYPKTTGEKKETDDMVVFDHVSFTYASAAAESLSDISFRVEKGQTFGIIGATGSGKTTVVDLIPRFYDATKGSVEVDGLNVRAYTREDLVKKIAVVPQKAVLFKGTIRDNMKWGNEDASDEEIMKAVERAQASEIIEGKGGLDAAVEQYGRNLSGGQRQRLTIARALVKNPEILIMDDSASALDFATDAKLRAAVASLDMTVFIVSQRTSSIRNADQILVLEDGECAGTGTHAELMETCEIYQEIYYSQFPEERPSLYGKEVQA